MSKTLVSYVPHGIDENKFYPISTSDKLYPELLKKKIQLFGEIEPEFVLFFNSRNIRRKMVSDVIISFKMFLSQLNDLQRSKCFLILHTTPIDDNGTNLYEVISNLAPNSNIIISSAKISDSDLNILYNIADATISISSAEGWGLSNTESLMAGTMTISNVIGGLQDQARFVDENGNWINFNADFPTNSCERYKDCGEWTIPIFPQLNLVGSVPTPYIYDSRANLKDVAQSIYKVYSMDLTERKQRGNAGRTWVLSDESNMSAKKMCENMMNCIDILFEKWKPKKKFGLYNTKNNNDQKCAGVYNELTEKWY